MSEVLNSNKPEKPDFLRLSPEWEMASTEELAERYLTLADWKLAGETRVGRHPSDRNNPADVERDPEVRQVLDIGLHHLVREMAAVHYELHQRPDGLVTLMRLDGWGANDTDAAIPES